MKIFSLRNILRTRSKGKRTKKRYKETTEEAVDPAAGKIIKERNIVVTFPINDYYCACCLKAFIKSHGLRCVDCSARVCRSKCSRLESQHDERWRCLFCFQQRKWLYNNSKFFDNAARVNFESDLRRTLAICCTHIDKLTVDARSMAYTALHKLVDHTVTEVCKTQSSNNSDSNEIHDERTNENEDPQASRRRYEDLLATVIINKVIEKYQLEQPDKNSTASTASVKDITEVTLHGEIESNSVNLFPQDECHSNYSQAESKFMEIPASKALPLTIEERIEEVTTCITQEDINDDCKDSQNVYKYHRVPFPELGMDIIDPYQMSLETFEDEIEDSEHATMISSIESWQQNWLFQRKPRHSHSNSVAMFVPNSNTEYRAMIGDKDAEDISDLSECSVQSDEEIEELNTTVPNLPVEHTNIKSDEVRESRCEPNPYDAKLISSTPKNHLLQDGNVNVSKESDYSGEQSADVFVNSLFLLINEKPEETSKIQISMVTEKQNDENGDPPEEKLHFDDEYHKNSLTMVEVESSPTSPTENQFHEDVRLYTPPLPGSIAEREHKKWENAPAIANNPYSKENIQKRLAEKKYGSKCLDVLGIKRNQNDTNFVWQPQISNSAEFELQEGVQNNAVFEKCDDPASIEIICKVIEGNDQQSKSSKNKPKIAVEQKVINNLDYQFLHSKENRFSNSSANELGKNAVKQNKYKHSLKNNKQFGSIDSFEQINDVRNDRINNESTELKLSKGSTDQVFFEIRSAKSFPDIANEWTEFQNKHEIKEQNILVQPVKEIDKKNNEEIKKENEKYLLNNLKSCSIKKSPEKIEINNEDNEITNSTSDIIMLPSVKKIVEDFNKIEQERNSSPLVVSKHGRERRIQNKPFKLRHVQTNQSPKHLHSLTARSLSKEFREGLRQVPKENETSAVNQCKILYNTKKLSNHYENHSNILKIHECRKLKNNIEFWEKIQRQK